ncbi:hypothetical protein D9619_011274 [Psilocybe cf. subviscida]|uniref:Uncharacterized protein n=1 Tax=Psilocybe cf. subviscida TaxID=2480587 RepID=A0A8H5BJ52_9AGAR|nr:hypothetical protein D9619_011274 [Psilocybe cf. subviscida]
MTLPLLELHDVDGVARRRNHQRPAAYAAGRGQTIDYFSLRFHRRDRTHFWRIPSPAPDFNLPLHPIPGHALGTIPLNLGTSVSGSLALGPSPSLPPPPLRLAVRSNLLHKASTSPSTAALSCLAAHALRSTPSADPSRGLFLRTQAHHPPAERWTEIGRYRQWTPDVLPSALAYALPAISSPASSTGSLKSHEQGHHFESLTHILGRTSTACSTIPSLCSSRHEKAVRDRLMSPTTPGVPSAPRPILSSALPSLSPYVLSPLFSTSLKPALNAASDWNEALIPTLSCTEYEDANWPLSSHTGL